MAKERAALAATADKARGETVRLRAEADELRRAADKALADRNEAIRMAHEAICSLEKERAAHAQQLSSQ